MSRYNVEVLRETEKPRIKVGPLELFKRPVIEKMGIQSQIEEGQSVTLYDKNDNKIGNAELAKDKLSIKLDDDVTEDEDVEISWGVLSAHGQYEPASRCRNRKIETLTNVHIKKRKTKEILYLHREESAI